MNPPSVSQIQVALNLQPLPQIWCSPHGLSIALASILNEVLDRGVAVTIETYASGTGVVIKLVQACPAAVPEERERSDFSFAVLDGHVRASGWELFAARQLVRETGGDLRIEQNATGYQTITVTLSANAVLRCQSAASAAYTSTIRHRGTLPALSTEARHTESLDLN
jgi:hypothetical protein